MFLEPKSNQGILEVIYGCMFSGKTEELISRVTKAELAGLKSILFKPQTDNRYHSDHIVSHNAQSLEGISLITAGEIFKHLSDEDVIGIDEVQFFDEEIREICQQLVSQKRRVIIAGLDMDFMARPFGPMPSLISMASLVTRLEAICSQCGNPAQYTYKKTASTLTIEIGEKELYEARCGSCFEKGMRI